MPGRCDYLLKTMFNEDLPKKKPAEFPRNLVDMSVAELEEYIAALKAEILRVEADRDKKRASQTAANAFFKS